jgi:hypothetical protein
MDKETLLSIGRPQRQCVNCAAPIDSIERHPSVLRAERSGKLERADYCPVCWEAIKDEAFRSFWITRRELKDRGVPKMTRRQRAVALRALFETLWEKRENEDEDVSPHLFVLSHLLMKWGGLKYRGNVIDAHGREIVVFEDPASGDGLEIPSLDLSDEQLLEIKNQIEAFLREYVQEDQAVAL